MRTLYVLRHGQAVPETQAANDHERQLTRRGEAEVQLTAQYLSKRRSVPSLVFTSSATRARQTAERCLTLLPEARLRVASELYLAEPSSYLGELAAGAEPHAAVMVVGHNPGLEALIYLLAERSEHL